jgi:hypothetical protein
LLSEVLVDPPCIARQAIRTLWKAGLDLWFRGEFRFQHMFAAASGVTFVQFREGWLSGGHRDFSRRVQKIIISQNRVLFQQKIAVCSTLQCPKTQYTRPKRPAVEDVSASARFFESVTDF